MTALAILPMWFKAAAVNVIWVISTIMMISAFASWIPQVRQSKVGYYLFMFTEPVVAPMRRLLSRIPALNGLPIDLSFMATYLVLIMLQRLIIVL